MTARSVSVVHTNNARVWGVCVQVKGTLDKKSAATMEQIVRFDVYAMCRNTTDQKVVLSPTPVPGALTEVRTPCVIEVRDASDRNNPTVFTRAKTNDPENDQLWNAIFREVGKRLVLYVTRETAEDKKKWETSPGFVFLDHRPMVFTAGGVTVCLIGGRDMGSYVVFWALMCRMGRTEEEWSTVTFVVVDQNLGEGDRKTSTHLVETLLNDFKKFTGNILFWFAYHEEFLNPNSRPWMNLAHRTMELTEDFDKYITAIVRSTENHGLDAASIRWAQRAFDGLQSAMENVVRTRLETTNMGTPPFVKRAIAFLRSNLLKNLAHDFVCRELPSIKPDVKPETHTTRGTKKFYGRWEMNDGL